MLSFGLEELRRRATRSETARHLILRIAFALEGYAIDCADVVGDYENAIEEIHAAGFRMPALPKPPELPESSAYATIRAPILSAILEFPQRCNVAERQIRFRAEIGDPSDVLEETREQALELGLRAIMIAAEARRDYDLPTRTVRFGEYDIVGYLNDQKRLLDERMAELAEARKRAEEKEQANAAEA